MYRLPGRVHNDDLSPFGLDTFHHTLYGRLAEIVGVRFHRETEHTHHSRLFPLRIPLAGSGVITGFPQHLVGDKILTGAVALHDGRHHALGDIRIVGEQLFGIFGQAVTAVAETRIVVMDTDTGGRVPHLL